MNVANLLTDAISRPTAAITRALEGLSAEQLNAHPAGHDNSIAWLVWHIGREIDVQVEHLGGQEVWKNQGFRERFNLGEIGDSVGYGHSSEEARSLVIEDKELLVEYVKATEAAYVDYVSSLSPEDLDEVVDTRWDPPVTRGARLVSMIDDAAQHAGQVAYAAGQL